MGVCASCGSENREGARYCDGCGSPLVIVPPQREQRKTVTVVFCDVVGSTALGESTDPEALRALLARYFERMKAIVERHGGTVEKFIGDAVMAVFGVPVLHEDDAIRAVRAADEMRAAVSALGLQVRFGVDTGEVVTGTEERLATGDPVNVAARLQQAAAPGEILLGAETLALAKDAVAVEALVPLELKGKKDPVLAYRLDVVEPDAPGLARRPGSRLVGRTHELRQLRDAFEGAVRRNGSALFTMLGVAGVGKSRLTREFLDSVDARVVEGRCLSYGDGITYWPVIEIVKQLGGSRDELLAGSPGAARVIAGLLGEAEEPTTVQEISWAFRKLLEASALERPLVVVFDDVHWGEATFLDLVEHVADLSREAPILLLCLGRPELLDIRPGWGGGKLNAATVLLEQLDAGETGELIEGLLDGEVLQPALLVRIRAAAEGNPLFLEEMIAMVGTSSGRDTVVPSTIKALLAARLDQLDPAERGVLERGSVEGQLFHSAAVEALAREPASVDRELGALVRKELVRPDRRQVSVGEAYRFRHLLIRDAAYDALPKALRADLHERFAGWLQVHGDELVERDEIVGYHLEQAYRYQVDLGRADAAAEALAARAGELLAASGRAARVRGDQAAAASLLERAIDLRASGWLELLPDLGELLFETGELTRAAAVLDEAIERARELGDESVRCVASVWRAMLAGHAGEGTASGEQLIALVDEAVPILERLGDDVALAKVLAVGARNRFYLGQARESLLELRRAHELALRAGDLAVARDSLIWMLGAITYGSEPVSGMARFIEEIPVELRVGLERLPWLQVLKGFIHAFSGRFSEALETFAESRQMARELGNTVQAIGASMFIGDTELNRGDPAAAERELRDGFDELGELGEAGYRSTVGSLLAEALLRLGRDLEAEEILSVVSGLMVADDADPQIRTRAVRARILARRGELGEAVGLAREAVELAAKTDYIVLHGNALLALASVLEATGAHDERESALRDALELFERKEHLPLSAYTRERLATGQARQP